MTTAMEHRWGHRVGTDASVLITRDGVLQGVGCVGNVSLSGALLLTSVVLPLHANVAISSPGDDRNARELSACVVRTACGNIAIEWRDMASREVIAFIQKISPDAAALETRDPCAA
jgi:hypothetical protein